MQTVFAIAKKNTNLYLNRAGYFDLLDNRIYLFFSKDEVKRYIQCNLPTDDYNIAELHFAVGKRYEDNLLGV